MQRVSNAIRFADLSSNNPILNVAKYVAGGHKYVMLKATQGTGYRWFESAGTADWMHDFGGHVGHYHWLEDDDDGVKQADFFCDFIAPQLGPPSTPGVWPPDGDWLMTDLERTQGMSALPDAQRAAQLKAFNERVVERYPDYLLDVYSGNWYLYQMPRLAAELDRWLVHMSDYSGVDILPNPYGLTYAAWQTTDRGWVEGMSEPVDMNYWLPEPTGSFEGYPTMTEKMMLKIARAVTHHGLQALATGRDHGWFTHKRFPQLIPGGTHGVFDRLAAVEQENANLRTRVKQLEAKR